MTCLLSLVKKRVIWGPLLRSLQLQMYSSKYLVSGFKCPVSMTVRDLDSARLLCPSVSTRSLLLGWKTCVFKFRAPWVDRLVIKWFPHSWESTFVPEISVQNLVSQASEKFPVGWQLLVNYFRPCSRFSSNVHFIFFQLFLFYT